MSSNCRSNTLFISRPTASQANNCCNSGGCTSGSLTDPACCGKIGKRPCRERVREQIRDAVLYRLGAPGVKIELTEENIYAAIDLALMEFEEYAGREYYNYYVFNTTSGKSVYTLPPDVGFVREVSYMEQPSLTFTASDIGGALPIEYYYPGGAYSSLQGGLMDPNQPIYGNAGPWVLYKQYENMYNRLSSRIGGWEWVDGFCNIKLFPVPCRCHGVAVHYLQKKYDFKQINTAMVEGALAFTKEMLGRVRGKYTNIPGPNGGYQLDGPTLLQEAKESLTKWREDLIIRWGDGPQLPITMG